MYRFLLIFISSLCLASPIQAQTVEPAPDDKAVVYFVRTGWLGVAIPFSYFDSTELIGHFNGRHSIRYECEPGRHLFWAKSENTDYVKANLQAGNIYVIHVLPTWGFLKAGVKLAPINTSVYSTYSIQKLLSKKSPKSLSPEKQLTLQQRKENTISRGLAKYANYHKRIKRLKDYTFSPEDLIIQAKS